MRERLQIYISQEADTLLRKKAASDRRSISATVELLIINATTAVNAVDSQREKSHVD